MVREYLPKDLGQYALSQPRLIGQLMRRMSRPTAHIVLFARPVPALPTSTKIWRLRTSATLSARLKRIPEPQARGDAAGGFWNEARVVASAGRDNRPIKRGQ